MEWSETTVGLGVIAGVFVAERVITWTGKLVKKVNGKDEPKYEVPCGYVKDLRSDFQKECDRVHDRDLKIAEDIGEIKTSIQFIVTELKNGTKFVKK